MQNLWWLIFITLCCRASSAEAVKVCTWNLHWFPSGSQNRGPEELEKSNITKVATLLRDLRPDVLVLQEVRDTNALAALQEALRPEKYELAVCSAFKEPFGGILGSQQVAILARMQASSAWFESWKTTSLVDPPRGFAFAVFRFGTNDLAVYGLHLKSNLSFKDAEKEVQLNMLKRELAIEQVLRHVAYAEEKVSERFEAVAVAGDFNTNPDQSTFASEATLQLLAKAAFLSGYETVPLPNRITCPGKGRYPDCTFDYIFVKGPATVSRPVITATDASDHYPVMRTIQLP